MRLDEPPQPEPAQVVSHAAGAVVVEREPVQRGDRLAKLSVAEAVRQQVEAQQCSEQGLHPPVAEAQLSETPVDATGDRSRRERKRKQQARASGP